MEKLLEILSNTAANDSCIHRAIRNAEDDGYEYACGETRICVWRKDWDFVIKIPRYGYTDTDYCQLEAKNYAKAVEYKVERVCLPIEYVTTSESGIAIYRQPRYTMSTRDSFNRENHYQTYLKKRGIQTVNSKGMVSRILDNCYCGYRIDETWMARVMQLYGKKFCRSFERWTQECHVNDLHNCNTGWLNNRPILLDYAGYHD